MTGNNRNFVIDRARIVTPTTVIDGESLLVEDGYIAGIGTVSPSCNFKRIDAQGSYLLPGLIDLHSDALEHMIEPRPRAVFSFPLSIFEFDKLICSCGITTMYHCVAFVDSDARNRELRKSDQAATVIREINSLAASLRARNRVHGRYDIVSFASLELVKRLVRESQIHFLSFMDHTPGQGQFSDIMAYKELNRVSFGVDDRSFEQMICERASRKSAFEESAVEELLSLCKSRSISLASHDDDSPERVSWSKQWGVSVSEFPVSRGAVEAAIREGISVGFGAPNILRGSSWSNNVSAREMLSLGYGDILLSDYVPHALLHAVFLIKELGLRSLPEAVNMATLNPARAAGVHAWTGSIEYGKEADLVLADTRREVPQIVKTFVAGKEVFSTCRN